MSKGAATARRAGIVLLVLGGLCGVACAAWVGAWLLAGPQLVELGVRLVYRLDPSIDAPDNWALVVHYSLKAAVALAWFAVVWGEIGLVLLVRAARRRSTGRAGR